MHCSEPKATKLPLKRHDGQLGRAGGVHLRHHPARPVWPHPSSAPGPLLWGRWAAPSLKKSASLCARAGLGQGTSLGWWQALRSPACSPSPPSPLLPALLRLPHPFFLLPRSAVTDIFRVTGSVSLPPVVRETGAEDRGQGAISCLFKGPWT